MPDGKAGIVPLEVKDNQRSLQLADSSQKIYRRIEAGFPVMTVEPSFVCDSLEYIDGEGILRQGTKICSLDGL